MHRHVLGQQGVGVSGQLGPQGQGPLQVVAGQRVLFHADKVQATVGPGVLLEQLPGAEKVQPGAETGFTDHQLLTRRQFGKAPGQVVLQQEGMAGFGQAAVIGEIHIGKLA